ncbi:MAG: HAMP domain-containing histidine kinase [Defluviitaleaceae bacterium]|nr:HAMP domain-containing histidine kinase [Defluviitaleaceae bacterium]
MRNFTTKLMAAFVGTIIGGFLLLYFLFNIFMANHIRAEVEQVFEMGVNMFDNLHEMPGNFTGWFVPMRQSLVQSSNFIILDHQNNVVSPFVPFLEEEEQREIVTFSEFFIANSEKFFGREIVRFHDEIGTYYLMTIEQNLLGTPILYLLYTDVTSIVEFQGTINRVLMALLVGLAVISLVISLTMSLEFRKSITALCRYSEIIGAGDFQKLPKKLNYTEFRILSSNMQKMAKMLATYENTQKQFFQNMSHELNTPLMSIQGYAEGILSDVFSEKQATKIILSESEKMRELVKGLLYVSRLDSGLVRSSVLYPVNIKNVVYDCCERLKIVADAANIQFDIHFSENEIFAETDDEKLEIALTNILTNALRYAKSQIKIDVLLAKDSLTIQIEDDGVGIAAADLPHIFERFYKGENGVSGLGLAISSDVVKSLGGEISAENVWGGGARFVVVLRV